MRRNPMTLTELHADKHKMLAWLAYDGNPPTVMVETAASRLRWGRGYGSQKEPKLVADEETLEQWWREYRRALDSDWQKVSPNRIISWQSFLGECARAMGFKKGKVGEKIAAARAHVRSAPIVGTPGDEILLDDAPPIRPLTSGEQSEINRLLQHPFSCPK